MPAVALGMAALLGAFALRGRRGSLAEVFLIAFLFFSSAVALVMYGLAAMDAVSGLAVLVATWSVAAAMVAAPSLRFWATPRLPRDPVARSIVARARTERLLFHASLLVLVAVFAYSVAQAWLLPSDSWDGIWYHDTITASVIQTGGTRPIPLPMNLIQQANGFPKLAELTSAWWCLTVGREASEFSNLLAAPALGAGVYLLARRFSPRDIAMGITCVVLLVPGSVLQWRTTYVDVLVSAFGVASLHFASSEARARFTPLLLAVSMALAVSTKWNVLPLIPGVIVVWLLSSSQRRTWMDWAATGAVVVVPALAFAATAIPNMRHFDNPLWPVGVSLPRLGVEWPGVRQSDQMNFNASVADTVVSTLLPATPGRDFADIRKGGYGLAFPWMLAPATLVSAAALGVRSLRRDTGDHRAKAVKRAPLLRASAVLMPIIPFVAVSPAIWSARYLLIAVAAIASVSLAGLRAWGATGRRIGSWLLLFAVALSVHRVWTFTPPLGGVTVRQTWSALAQSPDERATHAPAPWTISPEVARLRDKELARGTVVVFSDDVAFPSVLYNARFDNRVVYVPGAGPLEDALARLQPTWIVASDEEPLGLWVRARAEQWEPVGLASRGLPTTAYRKRLKPR